MKSRRIIAVDPRLNALIVDWILANASQGPAAAVVWAMALDSLREDGAFSLDRDRAAAKLGLETPDIDAVLRDLASIRAIVPVGDTGEGSGWRMNPAIAPAPERAHELLPPPIGGVRVADLEAYARLLQRSSC